MPRLTEYGRERPTGARLKNIRKQKLYHFWLQNLLPLQLLHKECAYKVANATNSWAEKAMSQMATLRASSHGHD
jgi:hypothetical protein